MPDFSSDLCARLLDTLENDIIPLTQAGVAAGNKVFGAAILRKSDLSLVLAGTNKEMENPLFHGEISCLNDFYKLPADRRPDTSDCIFLATHEPCSLCLSAITWTGFDNFYYFFSYTDTDATFNIPHDVKILQEVFKLPDAQYAHENAYWTATDLMKMAEDGAFGDQIARIKSAYDALSETYQSGKGSNEIPLN